MANATSIPLGAEALGYIDILMVSRRCGKFHGIPPMLDLLGFHRREDFEARLAGLPSMPCQPRHFMVDGRAGAMRLRQVDSANSIWRELLAAYAKGPPHIVEAL